MEELFSKWIVICPLVFLGGIIDAVAGGGGLITLPAYLLAGLSPHAAAATNKCGNMWGTILAAIRFIRRGEIHMASAVTAGIGALIGAWAGARINLLVSDEILYSFMLVIVPVMAVFLMVKKDFGRTDTSHRKSRQTLMVLGLLIGLAVGLYDGFFGPGAGTFLMLLFTWLCGFDLLRAGGNTKVVNAASNCASLVTFALAGEVVWMVGIPAAVCGMLGGYVGSGLALQKGARIIRPMFVVVLLLLTVRLVWDLMV